MVREPSGKELTQLALTALIIVLGYIARQSFPTLLLLGALWLVGQTGIVCLVADENSTSQLTHRSRATRGHRRIRRQQADREACRERTLAKSNKKETRK